MAAHLAPQKSECPAGTGQTQAEASKHDEILRDSSDERKAFATLAARLALKGYALHELSCGGFLISRQFLQRIGGDA